MKYFIFRNYTIEPFFTGLDVSFSGYEDVSYIEEADRYIWFYLPPVKANAEIAAKELSSYLAMFQTVLSRIEPSKMVIAFKTSMLIPTIYELSKPIVSNAVAEYNQQLESLASNHPNLRLVDLSDYTEKHSIGERVDWKYFFISQIPLNPKYAKEFSAWFNIQINAIELRRKKCLILDLDNTLWGGVLGEDGITGIKIGGSYPGNAFVDFQQRLLELSKTGVILAISSKNNEKDVIDLWEQHPFLVLKKEHFVAWRISWESKATNIASIAEELNIGLDSIVFVDDNPAERELVKQLLPMVEVPDFPKQPYELPLFFNKLADYFKLYSTTAEDKKKVEQYKANTKRAALQSSAQTYEDYLRSLEMHLKIDGINKFNQQRIAQLTQKTNQFNLTTKRYTEADLQRIAGKKGQIYCLNVSDKFGDSGISGVLIAVPEVSNERAVRIDTLLLSCRVLGRQIENAFVNHLLFKLKRSGVAKVYASYMPTEKNNQVATFYDLLGFTLLNESSLEKQYVLDLTSIEPMISEYHQIDS